LSPFLSPLSFWDALRWPVLGVEFHEVLPDSLERIRLPPSVSRNRSVASSVLIPSFHAPACSALILLPYPMVHHPAPKREKPHMGPCALELRCGYDFGGRLPGQYVR
jgi:hypothetical protein